MVIIYNYRVYKSETSEMSTHATRAQPASRGCLRYDGDMTSDRLGSQSQSHFHTKYKVVDKRGERDQLARGGARKRHRAEETEAPSPKRQCTHQVGDVLPGQEVGEDVLPVPSWFGELVGRPRRFVRCGVLPG